MNELQIFANPAFGQIRAFEVDGEPWFVGKDVAAVLGYSNGRDALARHVDDEDKTTVVIPDTGSNYKSSAVIINESGLYSLILSSKLPTAKAFKRWVTSEVLPSIRKHGGYIAGQKSMSDMELMARALIVAKNALQQRDEKITELETMNSILIVDNQIMKPKAEYFDGMVDRNLLTSLRETAKELGVKEKEFVKFLLNNKYLYRDKKGKLMPYAEKNDGLFVVKECYNEKTGWSGTQTLVTPKGRETFRLLCEGM